MLQRKTTTRGRKPFPFDAEMANAICERIATTELGLEEVLAERKKARKSCVSSTTIYKWLTQYPEFAERSARARKMQAELLHDRAQKYARDPLIGKIVKVTTGPDGQETVTTIADNVERSKLIVQTTLKRAGQLDAKKYGERVTLGGDKDNPIAHTVDTGDLIERIVGNRGATPTPSSE